MNWFFSDQTSQSIRKVKPGQESIVCVAVCNLLKSHKNLVLLSLTIEMRVYDETP